MSDEEMFCEGCGEEVERCRWITGDGSTECGAPAKLRHRGSGLCLCGEHGLLLTVRAGMMLEPLERRAR